MPSTRHPETDRMIGEVVKFWREHAKMTQTDLAAKLRCNYQNVQAYENGRNRISFDTLIQIWKLTGGHPADLTYLVDRTASFYKQHKD